MTLSSKMNPADMRKELGHPVLDNDGHFCEIPEQIAEYVEQVSGPAVADRYLKWINQFFLAQVGKGYPKTLKERVDTWSGASSFWGYTVNSYDRATAFFPRLYAERMAELGFDYCVAYPSIGLFSNRIEGDDELRVAACRATNLFSREMFKEVEGSMTPVAIIPMHTPQEALDELEFTVRNNKTKAVVLTSGSRRDIQKIKREHPALSHLAQRIDFYGIDSAYDYDPVWAKLAELKLPISFHGQTVGTWSGPISPTNNTFCRLAPPGHTYPALALGLLLGGVTSRFPTLKFQFAELGVGWMKTIWKSIYELWNKRGINMQRNNPANLDIDKMLGWGEKYASPRTKKHMHAGLNFLRQDLTEPEIVNEFGKINVTTKSELAEHFSSRFYAGCEADDPGVAWALSQNPGRAKLRTTFGSDIGHWDVQNAAEVLPEAYELVEKGWIDRDQLKDFLFTNAAKLYTDVDANFFKGTPLEKSVLGSRESEQ